MTPAKRSKRPKKKKIVIENFLMSMRKPLFTQDGSIYQSGTILLSLSDEAQLFGTHNKVGTLTFEYLEQNNGK